MTTQDAVVAMVAATGTKVNKIRKARLPDPQTLLDDIERALFGGVPSDSPESSPAQLWTASYATSVCGMDGVSTLTWEQGSGSVRRDLDCSGASANTREPIRFGTAVRLAPGTDVARASDPDKTPRFLDNLFMAWDPEALCWEQDWSGLVAELELEDAESTALGHWLCTGQWIGLLRVGVLQAEVLGKTECYVLAKSAKAVRRKAWAGRKGHPGLERWQGNGATKGLTLRVPGGRLVAEVLLDGASFLPVAMATAVAGGTETWTFGEWGLRGPGALPGYATFTAPSCTPVRYELGEVAARSPAQDGASWLAPPAPAVDSEVGTAAGDGRGPLGAWYDAEAPEEVEVWRGEGGHIFCEPSIGGETVGLFAIDTSTSCLILDPNVVPAGSDAERFAEHEVQGLGAQPMQTALCRGRGALQLGPLTLERPLFREVSLQGAIRGPPNLPAPVRVAGVLGYDFLRHCTLELASAPRVPGAGAGPLKLRIKPPGAKFRSERIEVGWQPLQFIGRVPHTQTALGTSQAETLLTVTQFELEQGRAVAQAEIDALAEGSAKLLLQEEVREEEVTPEASTRAASVGHEGLFKLALGVGGTDLIVGSAVARALGLLAPSAQFGLNPAGMVSGPGSRDHQMARLQGVEGHVRTVRLQQVAFRGATFSNVRALCYPKGDPEDLELSCYADGVLAGGLFRGCCLVLDYGNRRMSLAQVR